MAAHSQRRPDNAPGSFYVNGQCISCAACWKLAPRHLTSHPVQTYAYVGRQPVTEAEQRLCREAIATCPVEAIRVERAEGLRDVS
jgi:ferredoxin